MKQEYPNCFATLDIVFPEGEDGLRTTPESCLVCHYKTECLKTAMGQSDGLKIQEEVIDRAYESGMMTFMQRWSRKKALYRKMKEK